MKTRLPSGWVLSLLFTAGLSTSTAQDATNAVAKTSVVQMSPASPAKPYESPWYTEISKLAGVGMEDQVMFAFIDAAGTFNLTPAQIIHLRDLGVSSDLISAILQHDSEVALGVRQVPASTSPPSSFAFPKGFVVETPAKLQSSEPVAMAQSPAVAACEKELGMPERAKTGMESSVWGLPIVPGHWNTPVASINHLSPEPVSVSPVRKPYAEQLTDPIIVVRAAGRTPNLTVLEMFP